MAWIILVLSGVLEAVWAAALDRSEGFSHPAPTVVFVAALGLSMAGLSVAMRSIPLGTAYVVWVGVGAVLTVGYAMATGGETASIAKLELLTGIVACVVGLKLLH
jgi:quaternary ammonium compound-resistance protein SugE